MELNTYRMRIGLEDLFDKAEWRIFPEWVLIDAWISIKVRLSLCQLFTYLTR